MGNRRRGERRAHGGIRNTHGSHDGGDEERDLEDDAGETRGDERVEQLVVGAVGDRVGALERAELRRVVTRKDMMKALGSIPNPQARTGLLHEREHPFPNQDANTPGAGARVEGARSTPAGPKETPPAPTP